MASKGTATDKHVVTERKQFITHDIFKIYEKARPSFSQVSKSSTSRFTSRFKTSTPLKLPKMDDAPFGDTEYTDVSSIGDVQTHDTTFEDSFDEISDISNGPLFEKRTIGKSSSNKKGLFKKAMLTSMHCLITSRKCKHSCLSGYTIENVKRARTRVWTKSYEERVEWFSEKYSEAINKRKMIKFTVDNGQHICGTCFRNLYRIDKTFYYKHIGNFDKGAVAAGFQKSKTIYDSTDKLIDWLKDYSAFHGDKMPDKGITLLPYKTRKIDVYNVYEEEQIEKMERVVSQATFYRVWDEHFQDLKIKKTNSFSKCNTCTKLEAQLQATRETNERNEIKGLIKAHNYRQMMERKYYYSKRDEAKQFKRRYMSIIIDGMDQMKTNLPHFIGRQSNDLDMANLLKTHVQGIINHGMGRFTKYLDLNEYAHDSNMVMNTILKELHETSIQMGNFLPPTLYLQADNCYRENKNRFMLGFCELLVHRNIFKEVHLSFLYVGHTHEDIDAGFSKIADTLRRNEAGTIPRLLALIPNMKQLRGLYDIKSWISPSLNVFSQHTKPHHFRFLKDGSNIKAEYKGNHNSIWRQFPNSILKHPPAGIPKILLPQAMHKYNLEALEKNIDRAKFLFTDQSQVSWWKRFITYITEVKSSPELQLIYAKEGARWLLPLLPKQQEMTTDNQQTSRIDPGLCEMVDKELDEPMIEMRESVTRRGHSSNRGRGNRGRGRGRGKSIRGNTLPRTLSQPIKRKDKSQKAAKTDKRRECKEKHYRRITTCHSYVYYIGKRNIDKHIFVRILWYLLTLVYMLCIINFLINVGANSIFHYDLSLVILLWYLVIERHMCSYAHVYLPFLEVVILLKIFEVYLSQLKTNVLKLYL